MKSQTIEVYNWADIKEEICNQMGITIEKFHDYYGQNLWTICLVYLFPPFVADSIVEVFPFEDQLELYRAEEDIGGWSYGFLVAYDKVMRELAGGDDLGVHVRFG